MDRHACPVHGPGHSAELADRGRLLCRVDSCGRELVDIHPDSYPIRLAYTRRLLDTAPGRPGRCACCPRLAPRIDVPGGRLGLDDGRAALCSTCTACKTRPPVGPCPDIGTTWTYRGQPGQVAQRYHIDDRDRVILHYADGAAQPVDVEQLRAPAAPVTLF